jgi:hypothetical protein
MPCCLGPNYPIFDPGSTVPAFQLHVSKVVLARRAVDRMSDVEVFHDRSVANSQVAAAGTGVSILVKWKDGV